MAFTDDLRREAATLRARQAELHTLRHALTDACEETEAKFHEATAGLVGVERTNAHDEADALHVALCDYRARLNRCTDEKAEVESRLATVDRLLAAPERAAAGRAKVRDDRKAAEAVEKRLVDSEAVVERVKDMHRAAVAAAERARAQVAARAVAELPEDVRTLLGAQADPGERAGDAAAEDARASALSGAIERAERNVESLRNELARAQAVADEAEHELRADIAAVAELEHAAALVEYLPKLAAFRAAHEVAHGFAPDLPDFRRIVDASRSKAMEAARSAVRDGQDGIIKRAARRLAAAVGA